MGKKPELHDRYKETRDNALDGPIEEKLLENLRWSMLFFCFNHLCTFISDDLEIDDPTYIQKVFFKNWKKFINEALIRQDIEVINNKLNSDINLFASALKGEEEVTESTEIYQEKYYAILQKIDTFFQKVIDEHIQNLEEGGDEDE
jgi:hypothetical protein